MRASVIVQAIDDEIQALGGTSIEDTPNFVIAMMVDHFQFHEADEEAANRMNALRELLDARYQAHVDPFYDGITIPIKRPSLLDLQDLYPDEKL